jgi:hypothetical protein
MKILIFLLLLTQGFSQTWSWTGRTHGELNWSTIETEHYRLHYHQGIENIAKEGATIAEQVRPILLKQMDLKDIPTIDIIFTTEDEIMNGLLIKPLFGWIKMMQLFGWKMKNGFIKFYPMNCNISFSFTV